MRILSFWLAFVILGASPSGAQTNETSPSGAQTNETSPSGAQTNASSPQTKVTPTSQVQLVLSYAPLVKKTAPAVVNIYTTKSVRTRKVSPLFNDPFFRQFFDNSQPLSSEGTKRKVQNSLGSGIIIGADGVVVTNNHVIKGADEITVVLNDRREFSARILGRDKRTDLAVLMIDAKSEVLPYLELSDSDNLEIGDIVLAIGNPFGVGQTVTSGIISALARNNIGVSDLGSFIQTDAAINPGNSGGALINMRGQLVGVNTAIFTKSGGSHGIGFAIPANMVSHVVRSLITSGNVVRAWLGAEGQNVTSDIAQALGMSRPLGVMVTSLHDLGPAKDAGMLVGDVVLQINGHELANVEDLRFRIATEPVGTVAKVLVLRSSGTQTLNVDLVAPPEIPRADKTLLRGRHPFDGATVVNLSPAMADKLGFPMSSTGAMVFEVDLKKSAARLGMEPGDIILDINGVEIRSVDQLVDMVKEPQSTWLITLNRKGRKMNLVVR